MSDDGVVYFEIFPWNENFETGIELIDEQHKKLVMILNKLAANLANCSDDIILNDIFDELKDYSDYHFKSEEKIWQEYFKDDEWLIEHEHTHESFIDDILEIKNNKSSKPLYDVVYEIVSFLSKWLAYHILDSDKRLALAISKINSGTSLQQAKSYAEEEMDSSIKIIIDTVLDMYDALSTRTLDLMREKSLRLQAEEKLQLSEERLKFILDGSDETLWDWDIENDKIDKSEDYPFELDIISKKTKRDVEHSNIHPEDIENVVTDFKAHLTGELDFYVNKHRVLRENGSWSWILSRGKIVERNKDGKPLRMIGTHTDVTEREFASLIYENSSQAIYICDSNNTIIGINPSFTKITGYTIEDIIGKEAQYLFSKKHDNEFFTNIINELNSNGFWSGKVYNERKNGELFIEYLEMKAIKDANNSIDYYFALFNDITEEEKHKVELQGQEEHMLQQSRMAQMGEMISMIAHQWKQPLGAISVISMDLQMRIGLEKYDLEKEEERLEFEGFFNNELMVIDSLVQNLTTIMDDFRNFYKPNKQATQSLLNLPVSKALYIIKTSLAADGIQVKEKYESDKVVTMYENEIIQVILNILKNAQDNFLEKKIIKPVININTKSTKDGVALKICDNGGGITQDTADKIFNKYYSTKDEDVGTGLGLYMSKKIIETHHNGKLYTMNEDDGICFIIEMKELL